MSNNLFIRFQSAVLACFVLIFVLFASTYPTLLSAATPQKASANEQKDSKEDKKASFKETIAVHVIVKAAIESNILKDINFPTPFIFANSSQKNYNSPFLYQTVEVPTSHKAIFRTSILTNAP